MKLYVCWTTKGGDRHACARAYQALTAAGYQPKIQKVYGSGRLVLLSHTRGREEVKELSGNVKVPTLVLDDKTVIDGSENIVNWAKVNKKS